MYSIVQVIYGIPLNSNKSGKSQPKIIEKALEDEITGFLSYYSGGLDCVPSAFGVELGEFDCCCHHTELSSIKLSPTIEQVAEFKKLLANKEIPDELRTAVLDFGEPRVFFLWTNS